MSGGGGGGGSPQQGTTPYANAPTTQTFQPTLPGFQNMLAQQLAAGFGSGGGQASDFASLLSSLYRPMNVTQFKEPISQTAATYNKATNAPISTGNPALDQLLMGGGKVSK